MMSLERLKFHLDAAQRELIKLEKAAKVRPVESPPITNLTDLVNATTDRLLLGDLYHMRYLQTLRRDHLCAFVLDILSPGGLTITDAAAQLRTVSHTDIHDRSCYRLARAIRAIATDLLTDAGDDSKGIQARIVTPRIGGAGRPVERK